MPRFVGLVPLLHLLPGMNPTVDILQLDPEVPAGVFADLLAAWRVPFRILRPDLGEAVPAARLPVIVLGGRLGVHDEAQHPFLREVKDFMAACLAAGTPLLGICLGGQLLSAVAGGMVSSNRHGEKGLVGIALTTAGESDPLFAGLGEGLRAFEWHNDSFTIPPGAEHLAGSPTCPGQAFRIGRAWGLQFHPEVDEAIVASWSRGEADRQELTATFAAAAVSHQALAATLLANFLRSAGLAGLTGRVR